MATFCVSGVVSLLLARVDGESKVGDAQLGSLRYAFYSALPFLDTSDLSLEAFYSMVLEDSPTSCRCFFGPLPTNILRVFFLVIHYSTSHCAAM
mmetsp:Transcript_24696/g.58619  ORF Transcript_24696/g.58619 Transcript_24696/m.58619 type:complete len:94 (-) Transcript_24696:51-332(-)